MIIDHRTYTLRPGTLGKYLSIYQEEGLKLQSEHLGFPLGYYTVECGNVNQVIHLWQYCSFEDREKRRLALKNDDRWSALIPKFAALIIDMQCQLLRPASFMASESK